VCVDVDEMLESRELKKARPHAVVVPLPTETSDHLTLDCKTTMLFSSAKLIFVALAAVVYIFPGASLALPAEDALLKRDEVVSRCEPLSPVSGPKGPNEC